MQDLTPRTLIRARDAASFRDALIALAHEGSPLDAARRAVVVPTHAAAELLRQAIEARLFPERPAVVLPALLTRDDLLRRLHEALPDGRRLLSRIEREVLLERAAVRTAARPRVGGAPFQLRPGLIGALLDFYDDLNRRQRRVRRFARVLFDQLRVERGTDRGSESLVHQTAFMGLTFLDYERRLAASGALDEHGLRRALVAVQPPLPFEHLVVAVADHPSDPRGLWPADFDLIGRLRHLVRLDVVVTDETHDAGFRDRVERELPGITERRHQSTRAPGVIVRPPAGSPSQETSWCFVSRDREEELRDVARMIRERVAVDGDTPLASTAIVFHRPLPYVYLAPQVLTDEGVPHDASNALPLGTEPYAAMLDLVVTFARTGGTRDAAAALLRCGLLQLEVDGVPVALEEVSALSRALAGRRATGEAGTYVAEVGAWFGDRLVRGRASRDGAIRAARAAADVMAELAPYRCADSASTQLGAVTAFVRRHEIRLDAPADDVHERHAQARAAVLAALDALTGAYAAHDDRPREEAALTAAIRHAIEGQMSPPRGGDGGVRLVEASAARFGDFDHVHVVGMVESDWLLRARRSIFFTAGLLEALGWPQEPDEQRAQHAAFRDLVGLAARTTTLHAFELDGETVAVPSPVLPAIVAASGVRTEHAARMPPDRALGAAPDTRRACTLHDRTMHAARLFHREARPPLADRRYSGYVTPRQPQAYRVSAVDRYGDCPFKYFADTVLQLPEEREDAPGLTPIERGTLVHDLFERFYRRWDAGGRGTIMPATLPEALALFGNLVEEALVNLPEADRALESTRLLGSIVARGLADRVFELEADAGGQIVRRLVEYDLRGPFDFPATDGVTTKTIAIRGKADRIDVFTDDTLRVVDYKLGGQPDLDTSVQVAVYAHAARERLERAEGRPFAIGGVAYLAFGDDRRLEGRISDRKTPAALAVRARVAAFARHVERIEAGEFPPQPRRPADCHWCSAAGVCRKEYVTGVDDAAELV